MCWSVLGSQAKLSPDAANIRSGPQRARTARATRAARFCHRQPQKFGSFWVLSIRGAYPLVLYFFSI